MAAPNGLIVAWPSTNASIPAGWTRVTAGDGRYIKASVTMAGTGGSNTHTHTPGAGHTHTMSHVHGVTLTTAADGTGGGAGGAGVTRQTSSGGGNTHAHGSANTTSNATGLTADTPGASASGNGEPNHYTVIWIKSDGTTDIPNGSIMWWAGQSAPTNHGICNGGGGVVDLRDYFLKGAAAAGDGGTQTGAAAHTHTYSHSHAIASHNHTKPAASAGPTTNVNSTFVAGATGQSIPQSHTHNTTGSISSVTGTSATDATASDSATPDPLFTKIHHLKKTGASAIIPTGIIALINSGGVPSGWTTCDGTLGTPALNDVANPFIKGAVTNIEIGTTGGASTHTHSTTHDHGAGTHAHAGSTVSGGTVIGAAADVTSGVSGQIDHSGHGATVAASSSTSGSTAVSLPATSHEPAYYTAQFVQSLPVVVTSPNTRGINVNFTHANTVAIIANAADTRGINVNFSHVNTVFALTATLDDPLSGDIETNSSVPVAWTLGGGTQASYRIRVWADAMQAFNFPTDTTVYDSGQIFSGLAAATIPSGALDTEQAYWVQVELTDDRGLIARTDYVDFTTSWAPATNVVGVRIDVLGDCADDSLPGFVIHWDQVVPQGAESFEVYAVKRREAGETVWLTLTTIDTIGTLKYSDFDVKSDTLYEYSIVWHASDPVAGELVSMDQDPPATARVHFDYIFLHEQGTPANWSRLESFSIDEQPIIEPTFARAWGRSQPTMFIGEAAYSRWTVRMLPLMQRDRARAEALRSLLFGQRTSTTLVLRFGIERTRYFVQMSGLSRSLSQLQHTPQVDLMEVHYEEGLTL